MRYRRFHPDCSTLTGGCEPLSEIRTPAKKGYRGRPPEKAFRLTLDFFLDNREAFCYTGLHCSRRSSRLLEKVVEASELRNWLIFLAVLAILGSGCAGESKETTVKCPKCGAIFTIQEGVDQYQMQAH